MAAPRAFWKGYLRLSLVSINVALISATERSASISLRQIHKPSGKRIRYEKVAPGIGPVDDADIVKGFELDQDGYVVLEPDELDAIKLESRRAIRLAQFVERGEIDPRYFDRPYYVVPEGEEAAEGYVVIRDALDATNKSGLGQMTMRGREHLVAVRPCGRGLLLETLRYGAEVRAADRIFDDIPDLPVDDEMRSLAHELIDRKTAAFDPDAFHDSYASALRELIEHKRQGEAVIGVDEGERRKSGEVVDLMAALRASVEEDKGSKGTRKAKTPRRSRKAS